MFYIKFKQLHFFKLIFSVAELPPCGGGLQNGQPSTGAVIKLVLVILTVKNAWVKSVYHTAEYTICSHFTFLHAQMYLPSNENITKPNVPSASKQPANICSFKPLG